MAKDSLVIVKIISSIYKLCLGSRVKDHVYNNDMNQLD